MFFIPIYKKCSTKVECGTLRRKCATIPKCSTNRQQLKKISNESGLKNFNEYEHRIV